MWRGPRCHIVYIVLEVICRADMLHIYCWFTKSGPRLPPALDHYYINDVAHDTLLSDI